MNERTLNAVTLIRRFFSFCAAAAVLFGVMSGTVCNFATQLKFTLGYDDTLDIFASHAIGGVVGNVSVAMLETLILV